MTTLIRLLYSLKALKVNSKRPIIGRLLPLASRTDEIARTERLKMPLMNRKEVEFTYHIWIKQHKEKMRFAEKFNLKLNKHGDVNHNSWCAFLNRNEKIDKYYYRLTKIFRKTLHETHKTFWNYVEEQKLKGNN